MITAANSLALPDEPAAGAGEASRRRAREAAAQRARLREAKAGPPGGGAPAPRGLPGSPDGVPSESLKACERCGAPTGSRTARYCPGCRLAARLEKIKEHGRRGQPVAADWPAGITELAERMKAIEAERDVALNPDQRLALSRELRELSGKIEVAKIRVLAAEVAA